MTRAVKHLPPFEKESDKGIKDAVLAHTVRRHADRHSAARNRHIIVITNDHLLQTYLGEVLNGIKFDIYSSLEEFGSNLRLVIDELGADLLSKAKMKFYTRDEEASLYNTAHLATRLKEEYTRLVSASGSIMLHITKLFPGKLIDNYPISTDGDWESMDRKITIIETTFVGRSGRLKWSTIINFQQAYALSNANRFGNNPVSVVHSALFEVKWSSRLGVNRSIISTRIDSTSVIDEVVQVDSFANIDYENRRTNLTRKPQHRSSGLVSSEEALATIGVTTRDISSPTASTGLNRDDYIRNALDELRGSSQ